MKNTNLKLDAEGYYEVHLSDLNRPDCNGAWKLPLSDAQIALVNERAALGMLRGEFGQPVKSPMEQTDDFIGRVASIAESNTVLTIKEIRAEMIPDPREPTQRIQRIMGRVKPAGPRGPLLLDVIQRNMSVYFGLRAICDTPKHPKDAMHIRSVISWDMIPNDPYP